MQKARARSFLLHTKMEHLAFLWVLHTILIQFLILLMFHSVLTSHIQKHLSKLGLAHWWTLLPVLLQGERNTQLVMVMHIQNHRRKTQKDKKSSTGIKKTQACNIIFMHL
jgi:hypothetical protein